MAVQGRTFIERVSLIAFIFALSAVVLVFISRNSDAESPGAAVQHNAPVSETLGLQTQRDTMIAVDRIQQARDLVGRLGFAAQPTLAELLVAAAQVQHARDFYVGIGAVEPTPTFGQVLVAADQIQRAQDFFERTGSASEPTLAEVLVAADQIARAQDFFEATAPTLEETLIAADQLQRFAEFVKAASVPVTPIPSVPPPPPSTDTPVPPPPATSTPVPPPPPATAPAQPPRDTGAGWYDEAFEADIFANINEKRAVAGLGPLTSESRLAQAAKLYAKVLADFNWFSHTGPDGSDLVSRTGAAGFPFTVQIGEVIAWGSDGWPPADIVQAWLDSPSHREQIMSGVYSRAGIGCYFTDDSTLMVRCVMDLAE